MGEYIERAAFLDAIERMKPYHQDADDIAEMLQNFPAADVRPVVKAKWELDSDKLPICSNCGEIALQRIFVKVPHLIQDVRMVRSNFCSNCGADMREES